LWKKKIEGDCVNSIKASLSILAVIVCASVLQAEIYRWTDENGVTRYSNEPPAKQEKVDIVFEEYKYDEAADKKRTSQDNQEIDALLEEIEKQDRKASLERRKKLAAAKKDQPLSQAELIKAEEQRLQNKIVELEALPFDHFGSEQKRRAHINYYRGRLEFLQNNPDKYFSESQQP
jgi:hypothetical protein